MLLQHSKVTLCISSRTVALQAGENVHEPKHDESILFTAASERRSPRSWHAATDTQVPEVSGHATCNLVATSHKRVPTTGMVMACGNHSTASLLQWTMARSPMTCTNAKFTMVH
jgi:hypothetical protein